MTYFRWACVDETEETCPGALVTECFDTGFETNPTQADCECDNQVFSFLLQLVNYIYFLKK